MIGTTYTGIGLGNIVASGVASTSYTLVARYEGIHIWYITATDNVGHASGTHSWFGMYYEIAADEKRLDYYEIIVTDFAGNHNKKKLTSQYSLLTWFHTSIDRSSYK